MTNKIVIALSLLMISLSSEASQVSGKISSLVAVANADAFLLEIKDGKTAGTVPACATQTNSTKRYAIKASTAQGRAMLATAMLAYTKGKVVAIHGWEKCDSWFDAESIIYLTVN